MAKVMRFAQRFSDDLPSISILEQELSMWLTKCKTDAAAMPAKCSTIQDAYQLSAANGLFPNVTYLLKLLLTIPVTSASVERSNSTLKYVKTSQRNSLSQASLNALVLGYKHRDLVSRVKTADLVSEFARMKNRRLLLVNPVSE